MARVMEPVPRHKTGEDTVDKFGGTTKQFAEYLNRNNPDHFGHSCRRSSVSILVGGRRHFTIKKHGRWCSSTVAEAYSEESVSRKFLVTCQPLKNRTNNANSAVGGNQKPNDSTNIVAPSTFN